MTPPSAPLPKRAAPPPRSTSMRSTWRSGIVDRSTAPRSALFSRTPSSSTSTCSDFEPRIDAVLVEPSPPKRRTFTPGTCSSTSSTVAKRSS